jgi:hypothetical protein
MVIMRDEMKKTNSAEDLLLEKMAELIELQNQLNKFVRSDHKSKETRSRQKEIDNVSEDVHCLVSALFKDGHRENANTLKHLALYQLGKEVNELSRELRRTLDSDLLAKRHDEAVDVVKVVSAATSLAVASITIAKSTFDPNSSHAFLEASVGACLGIGAAFYKKVASSFMKAGKAICNIPREVQDSLLTHYFKEGSKQLAQKTARIILQTAPTHPARITAQRKGLQKDKLDAA